MNPGSLSLVAVADGTTSLYLSNGGMIDGSQQKVVTRRAAAFLKAAESNLAQLSPAGDLPLPRTGWVRFNVLTYDGPRSAEVEVSMLEDANDELWPLFSAGYEVLRQLRLIHERR